jgi:hypothetical protein
VGILKPGHYAALAVAGGLLGWLAWSQWRSNEPTGGLFAPPAQPPADNDFYRMGLPPDPSAPSVVPRAQHHAGYTYTPHRYPRACGGEITAVIHRGFSTMRIPAVADVQWMIAPPSEVMW